MATLNYTIKVTDRLLRFNTTGGNVIVTLLPFVQTPNAPYEIHKISHGDGNTVTIQVDPSTTDFLLPGGATSIVLDDTNNTVIIKIPADGLSPAFVTTGGGSGSGGGGGGGAAPNVTINPPAELIWRNDHLVEIDVPWTKATGATTANFTGAHVYLEDPDISSGANEPLDGSLALNASSQVSGTWAPVSETDSVKSPAVVLIDTGDNYQITRNVRIYLAAYGPNSSPVLTRATDPSPTPNIMVEIPQGPQSGQSGMEWAFLVTGVSVTVNTDFNRPDPNYSLTFFYTPPDPSVGVPPGVNRFGGCRIVYVQEDSTGKPVFPGTDSGIDVPSAQALNGYKSPIYTPSPAGTTFRCYFCSEDDSIPLGTHINTLVDGVTPYVEAVVPPLPTVAAPDVTSFLISNPRVEWQLDGTFVAAADFTWSLPSASAGGVRYAGVFLYLVNVSGSATLLLSLPRLQAVASPETTVTTTPFPKALAGPLSNVASNFTVRVMPPASTEQWTIAAISVDVNGKLSDDPAKFGTSSFHSPTQPWTIGPPQPGSPGGGQEYAPFVTIQPASGAGATETLSADGVRMVTFNVGSWVNPTDPQFGGAQIAMVVNHDPTKPTYWSIPKGQTTFQTPTMPSFGNIGATVAVDFYVVSDDPQGRKNTLVPGTTPVVNAAYTPTAGAVIPARSGWFDPSQFAWTGSGFQAQSFSAQIIQVGKTLVVGGAPSSFGGQDNGQIAVMNSSGVLRAWMGEQQPGQGSGAPLWGAWFGQLWVGGTNPLDAPLYIDNQGIIIVGGISSASTYAFPYISVRDDHGIECGRIGAKLNAYSGSGADRVGSSPPNLTSGAWFTQLAVGGSSLTNWNLLIVPDTNNPLGSQFKIRNVNIFQIDYPAFAGTPANQHYILEFGNSVWMAGGLTAGAWQFPGIHIYEVDGGQNNFGATFINRGMVLRGTQTQGYTPLVSLVTFNGESSGSEVNQNFWGVLSMYSPLFPDNLTVQIASGGGTADSGGGFIDIRDRNNGRIFAVDASGCYLNVVLGGAPTSGGARTPVVAQAYSVVGTGGPGSPAIPVIDVNGYWVGRPIGAQTPWSSDIDAANWSLRNVGSIYANQYLLANGNLLITSGGQFVGTSLTASGQVYCDSLAVNGVTCVPSGGNGIWTGNGVQTTGAVYGIVMGIFGHGVGFPQGPLGYANGVPISFTATINGATKTVTVNGGLILNITPWP